MALWPDIIILSEASEQLALTEITVPWEDPMYCRRHLRGSWPSTRDFWRIAGDRGGEHTAIQWKLATVASWSLSLQNLHPSRHEWAAQKDSHYDCNGGSRDSFQLVRIKEKICGLKLLVCNSKSHQSIRKASRKPFGPCMLMRVKTLADLAVHEGFVNDCYNGTIMLTTEKSLSFAL